MEQQWKNSGYVDDRPIISNFPEKGDTRNVKYADTRGEVLVQEYLEGPAGTGFFGPTAGHRRPAFVQTISPP